MTSIQPWTVRHSETLIEDKWITVRSDCCVTKSGAEVSPYYVVHWPDWINVVAVTHEGGLVLLKQYRHGTGTIDLGLPSGTVEVSDSDFSEAARRELLEETGYSGEMCECVFSGPANSAKQTNGVATFVVTNAQAVSLPTDDDRETSECCVRSYVETLACLSTRELEMQIYHVAAIFTAALWLVRRRPPELSSTFLEELTTAVVSD